MIKEENQLTKTPFTEKIQKLPTMACLGLDNIVKQHRVAHETFTAF